MQTLLLTCIAFGIAGAAICLAIKVWLAQHENHPRRMSDAAE